jgi:hypothetical protein
VKEETGIDISACEIEMVDDSGGGQSEKTLKGGERVLCEMKFYVYKVAIGDKNADEIKISLDDDLVEFKWIKIGDLKNIELTPPSMELFKKLGYI